METKDLIGKKVRMSKELKKYFEDIGAKDHAVEFGDYTGIVKGIGVGGKVNVQWQIPYDG